MNGEARVGYWDSDTGLFTSISQTRGEVAILTHYPLVESRIRGLPGFAGF